MTKSILFAALLLGSIHAVQAQCTTWVDPSPTNGWTDFGTVPCTGDSLEITAFEVYKSEAYALAGVVEGGAYSFGMCNGPGAYSWVPDYTVIAPSGAIDNFGPGVICGIIWTASESGTYLIVINEEGNCGVAGAIGNGYPKLITISGGVDCLPAPVFVEGSESFESGSLPECWQVIDADGDGSNWYPSNSDAFEGTYSIRSDSYDDVTFEALTPDNYLITPLLDLGEGDSLYYVISSFSAAFEAENYSILVSTAGTEIADFTDEVFTEVLTSDEWESRSIDFSAYNNQSIYIAFRHHNVTDEWGILMDGIALPGEVFCEPSNVRNLSKVEAQLYPNPTRNQVNIKTAMIGYAQVNIFDATGRMVAQISVQLNGQIFTYDVSSLENGFYTLQMTTENQVAVQKFLKQ